MNISTRGRYGTQALFELALHQGEGPMPLRQVAENQGLSEAYLEQLFAPLRKAGLVRSLRGAQGGYMLARDASEITVGDILRVLEGPIAPTDCALPDFDRSNEPCQDPDYCTVRKVWVEVKQAIEKVVDGITLADLVRDAQEAREHQGVMYYI